MAAFGAIWFFFPLAIPLGIPGTILAVVARRRVRSGETREGRAFVDVALWVGVASVVIGAGLLAAYIAQHA